MVRKLPLLAMVVGLLVASSFIGAAAFTSATVQRDVTVGINADDAAIIGLAPGTADATKLTSQNELVIQPDTGVTNGLNQDGTFVYGSTSNANSSNAFTITNNDDVAHNFTLSYKQSQSDATLTFTVAADTDGDGTLETVSFSNGGSNTITLNSGQVAYVVIELQTPTDTTTIQGTLRIDAA